jgi:hypothetical protein
MGFIWFLVGGATGGLFLVLKAFSLWPLWRIFITSHAHIMFVGFLTHLVMGVSDWMFPRPKQTRYTERRAMAVLFILDAGLLLRIIFEPWLGLRSGPFPQLMLALSGILQFLAIALFVYNIWDRIYMPEGARAAWLKAKRQREEYER